MIHGLISTILAFFGFAGHLFGAVTFTSTSTMATAEDTYFSANGKYLQVLANDTLPSYESGTVAQKLGKDMPLGTQVIVYQQADGQRGYQIITVNGATTTSTGFGPQAKDRTYQYLPPAATSTP